MPSPICPICDAGSKPFFEAAVYRMHQCDNCHTAFVSPMPSSQELADFYSRYHEDETSGGRYGATEGRMDADFPSKVQMVLHYAGKDARLLDVGCGKAFFLDACKENGLDVWGIDLSDTAIAQAKVRFTDRVRVGNLKEVKKDLGQFDVITLWATIEHLPDPKGMIGDISSLLKPGGHLILDTGIADDWLERLLPGRTQWYTPPEHLFVFSQKGLEKLLCDCDLRVVKFDPNWERTRGRRIAKNIRNGAFAVGIRAIYKILGIRQPSIPFTRFSVGNLQSIVAVKK